MVKLKLTIKPATCKQGNQPSITTPEIFISLGFDLHIQEYQQADN